MEILFCGDTFPAAAEILRKHLPDDDIRVGRSSELVDAAKTAQVLIPLMCRIDGAVLQAGGVRLIQQWGAGLEGVDFDAARLAKAWVANVPASGANADSVAEHALMLTLALLRRLDDCLASIKHGRLGQPLGMALYGRRVTLYGLGNIAGALAQRLRPFGVRLQGIGRDPTHPRVKAMRLDACYSPEQRIECLSQTDILIMCLPLTAQTRDIIDTAALAVLPDGALLINVGRGGTVNYAALYESLRRGRLGGAGLDVFWQEPMASDDPLLALPQVLATPHVAGVTDRSYDAIAKVVVENIERLRRGEPPLHRAD